MNHSNVLSASNQQAERRLNIFHYFHKPIYGWCYSSTHINAIYWEINYLSIECINMGPRWSIKWRDNFYFLVTGPRWWTLKGKSLWIEIQKSYMICVKFERNTENFFCVIVFWLYRKDMKIFQIFLESIKLVDFIYITKECNKCNTFRIDDGTIIQRFKVCIYETFYESPDVLFGKFLLPLWRTEIHYLKLYISSNPYILRWIWVLSRHTWKVLTIILRV